MTSRCANSADRIGSVLEGAYPGPRAAALAGVPKSTVYYWARNGVVVPSISSQREMFWSYADLMGLRVVYWLRQHKQVEAQIVRATPMDQVRSALGKLADLGIDLWTQDAAEHRASPLVVDMSGCIYIENEARLSDIDGQMALGDEFCRLLGPFDVGPARGPDLVRPRPLLRIVPGKLCGEPHVAGSRLSTQTIDALHRRGLGLSDIGRLYPALSPPSISQALDLEGQLSGNLTAAA